MDLKYPITIVDGGLAIGELTDLEAALSTLLTLKGERPLNPDYGTDPYLFNPNIELGFESETSAGVLIVNSLIGGISDGIN